jgi:hypothetical protein
MQNASDDLDVDPIKATGKRIGRINGSDIYKHEDAYYFDAPAKPKNHLRRSRHCRSVRLRFDVQSGSARIRGQGSCH